MVLAFCLWLHVWLLLGTKGQFQDLRSAWPRTVDTQPPSAHFWEAPRTPAQDPYSPWLSTPPFPAWAVYMQQAQGARIDLFSFILGFPYQWDSLVAQLVKNLPAMWETWFDAWVGKIPWRRDWLLTPVLWPGEFHGLYSPWGCRICSFTASQRDSHTWGWLQVNPKWKTTEFHYPK